MENPKPDIKALSASRIKTLESCSWLYWAAYHLKLPQIKNDGAKKGDICHSVFEQLLNKKHNKIYKTAIKSDSVLAIPAIERLVMRYCGKLSLDPKTETLIQLDRMIMCGLKNDFFVKGGTLIEPEFKFDITNEDPKYYIKGFMDKPFMKKDEVIIDDFKSSKVKFQGEDEESNIQAMIYSLAAKKLWPDKKPKVRFIFLQFPEDPIMEVKFTDDALAGCEYYLADVQKKVDTYTINDAKRNFAFDQEVKGGEFKGKLMCGFATYPHEKKKDGNPKWYCPCKFPFHYYVIKNKEGKIIKSSFKKDDFMILGEGETLERVEYSGCPRFQNPMSDMKAPPPEKPKKYKNVLDDF